MRRCLLFYSSVCVTGFSNDQILVNGASPRTTCSNQADTVHINRRKELISPSLPIKLESSHPHVGNFVVLTKADRLYTSGWFGTSGKP